MTQNPNKHGVERMQRNEENGGNGSGSERKSVESGYRAQEFKLYSPCRVASRLPSDLNKHDSE